MTQLDMIKKTFSDLSGKKIVVDLTPMLPGGENGGAKLMTLELVNALARLLPNTSFVLLTADSSHNELDGPEKKYPNIERMCILHNRSEMAFPNTESHPTSSLKNEALEKLKSLAGRLLPSNLTQQIKNLPSLISAWRNRAFEQLEVTVKRFLPLGVKKLIRRWRKDPQMTPGSISLVSQMGANLLFCPFTAPFYADSLIPTVSVIYDLQYRAYPQFFTPEEVVERENNFRTAYQKADYLVAISEFVRQTVIKTAQLPSERVVAVPIGLLRTPKQLDKEASNTKLLEKYGVRQGEYILYPANFWQHKNHAMLLTAFNIYRQTNPGSPLKLLCTGAPGHGAEAFCEATRGMGLTDWAIYSGYLTPDEYDCLLRSTFAMIFPSLYEGFGIPVLEAMSASVPVLCSNVTSLPEVGGDAVLYFDPRRPRQIVDALARLSEEPDLRESLIAKGLQRASLFESVDRMAVDYAEVFIKALLPQANGQFKKWN